ncbi:MAG TPA: tandem-95 repeat protein, partial [Ramlibacter sp.]
MQPRVVGTVVLIEGVVFARSSNGSQRQLRHGDSVYEGEVITTQANAHVELAFVHGGRFVLRANESITLNEALFDNVFGQAEQEGSGTLLGRVAEATDPNRIDTKGLGAGREPEDDSSSGAELNDRVGQDLAHGFVRLDRIAEPLDAAPFEFGSGLVADVTPHTGVEYEGRPSGASPALAPVAVAPAPAPAPQPPAVEPAPPRQVTPGAQLAQEDGVLVFSNANGNAISVSDTDSAVLTTTLQVSRGTLTLAEAQGLVVTGNGTDTVTLQGSPAAINSALEGLGYRPLPNDTATATLTVITSDEATSVGASVQIGVQPVVDAPVGTDDAAATREDTAVRIPVASLLANDTDPDGGVLAITSVGGATGGTVILVGGEVVFTPAPGFTGVGGFDYVLSDGQGGTDTVRVVVTVAGNDGPNPTTFSGARSGTGAEDGGVVSGTLRATDADGMAAPNFAVAGMPRHGMATIDAATGRWSYTPNGDYNGSDSFVVRVTDDDGNVATQVISLSVTPVADIAGNAVSVGEDASVTSNLLGNDSFEGRPVITAVTQGANGTVTIIDAAAGTVRYTPDAGFQGTDRYTYTVTSGGVTETATVTVTVDSIDDRTSFGGDTGGTGAEDGAAITGTLTASDADGMSAPAFIVVGQPQHGTATIDAATGAWSYRPAADYNGADSFTVRVRDDQGNSSTRVISLGVSPVADAVNNSVTVAEDGSATSNVLGNDSFEGATPRITGVTSGAHGTVTIVDAAAGTIRYTPDPDFNGVDRYTYTVTSGGVTETATVTVNVTSVNDAGSFGGSRSGTGAEDAGAITGTLTAADAGDGMTAPAFTVTGAAAHGTATINPSTGTWTYTPTGDYNGPDRFTVTVTDDDGNTSTQVISLTVSAVADIAANAATVNEDGSVTRNLLANDSFENAGATIVGVTQGANGTVTIVDGELGTVRYTPAAGFHGTDTYTYTVTSGGVTETATVTVTVNPVDDATGFGGDRTGSGAEDGAAITGRLTATDADGLATPSFTVVGNPLHGTASIDPATGAWRYVPAGDYNGTDRFTVQVTDDDGNTATRVITLAVTPVADIAGNTATVAEDRSVTSSVLGNDSFEATPTLTAVTNGAHGTVTIVDAAAGTVLYTPDANFHGTDSYTYTVTSGGVTETATVTVTVTPVNDATVFAGNTTGVGAEDAGVLTGVLRATDADGMASPGFTVTGAPAHGTASIDPATGAWRYTPDADYNGADRFTVTVTDADGNTATRTINLSVTPVVDIAGNAATTAEDTAVTRDLLANDSFESAARSITAVTNGAHGTVTIVDAALGLVRYTPDANYTGTDAYTYTVTAGGVSETVTVNVTITPANDPVTFSGDRSGTGNEDAGPITGALRAADAADGMSAPAFTVVGAAAHGTASINAATGAWTYTPTADYNGTDSFTVRVTDDAGNTATRVITLTVGAVRDIAGNAATVAEDGSVTSGLLGNDSFEGTPTMTAVTNGANGTVTIIDAAAGTVRYTPNPNFNGTDSYTYTVTSGGVTETATVTVTVTPVDDATSFGGNTTGARAEDAGAITGTLSATDGDGMAAPNYAVTGGAAHGTAGIDATGAWTYTPRADYNGPDSFTVTVTDDAGNTATQVISLAVTAVADARADAATVVEDGSVTTAVRGNDTFEGATPTLTAVSQGAHGTVIIIDAAAGTIRYTPDANWNGTDSYTYTVTSGGVTETATVTVRVTPVNDPATFGGATTGAGAEDAGAITGTLTAADAADGMAAPGFTVTGNPAHGTATINAATGAWRYTPTADYNGADSFTVTVTDDDGNTSTRVVNLTVSAAVDIAPNSASVNEDGSVTRNLLANDSFEHPGAEITAVTQGANGTVTIIDAELGTVRYTPNAGFSGTDSYTYTVTSGGVTETATVTITVTPVDDATSFGGATTGAGLEDGGAITGTLTVTDADGIATPAFTVSGAAAHGVASINPATGAWTYTPTGDYNGPDSFTVSVTDDAGNTATRVITLAVGAVRDSVADAITVAEDGSVTTAVRGNDSFEGLAPTITSVTNGAHGTVTII